MQILILSVIRPSSLNIFSCSYGPNHSNPEPFQIPTSKCSDFEWALNLNVRYSSLHCASLSLFYWICPRLLNATGSVPFTDFSEGLCKKLEELSRQSVGSVKVVFKDDLSTVEFLCFVGHLTLTFDSLRSQRQHGLGILGEYQLV